MTILIYDGENILMDRVVNYTYGKDSKRVVVNEPVNIYFESPGKINIPNKPIATFYDEKIVAWSIVGIVDQDYVRFINGPRNDLKMLPQVVSYFGTESITKGTHLYALLESGNLGYVIWEGDKFNAYEVTVSDYSNKLAGSPFIAGYGRKAIVSFLDNAFARKVTALEALVYAQMKHPVLGKKFDHYHIPTGKLTTDLNLSDRQRNLILRKLCNDITITGPEDPTEIQLLGK